MSNNSQNHPQVSGPVIQTTLLPIVLQTHTNRIKGKIHLRENERIKDALNTSDSFIAITEVKVFDVEGLALIYETGFLAINLAKISWVIEDGANIGVSSA